MAYLDSARPRRSLDVWRVLVGAPAATIVPSLLYALTARSLEFAWPIAGFGALSVLLFYLPLIAWRLPRTRRPLLTCVTLGIVAAPGPLGYTLGTIGSVSMGSPGLLLGVLLFTAPLGAVGGFTFWFFAVWRSEESGPDPDGG